MLDEANRASILDSLIPLVRGRRFILVGDHLQLQPVLSEAEEQLRLEPAVGSNASAIGKSLFAWLRERRFPEAATVFLDEQNRMHPVIAGLISEVFYEGKLRSGRRAPRRVADVPLFPAAVTWVDTRGLHGLREARGRGASLVNVPEARLVATIARHILATSRPDVETGVISAYAEQTALLRRLLLHRGPRQNGAGNGADGAKGGARNGALTRDALRLLEIDTVDAFEGREKDIIIVSLVRSNRRRDIGFLRLMQRINVALSRARTMLIIVGDTSTLRGSYFDRIVRYVRANGMLVPGPRLIGRLLNARNSDRLGSAPAAHRRAHRRAHGRRPAARPAPTPAAVAPDGVPGPGHRRPGGPAGRRRGRRRPPQPPASAPRAGASWGWTRGRAPRPGADDQPGDDAGERAGLGRAGDPGRDRPVCRPCRAASGGRRRRQRCAGRARDGTCRLVDGGRTTPVRVAAGGAAARAGTAVAPPPAATSAWAGRRAGAGDPAPRHPVAALVDALVAAPIGAGRRGWAAARRRDRRAAASDPASAAGRPDRGPPGRGRTSSVHTNCASIHTSLARTYAGVGIARPGVSGSGDATPDAPNSTGDGAVLHAGGCLRPRGAQPGRRRRADAGRSARPSPSRCC